MFNLCYCGSAAGYPHAADCPYPLFRATESEEDRWFAAREALADRTAEPRPPDEGPNYRDFAPPKDCYPEDGDEPRYLGCGIWDDGRTDQH